MKFTPDENIVAWINEASNNLNLYSEFQLSIENYLRSDFHEINLDFREILEGFKGALDECYTRFNSIDWSEKEIDLFDFLQLVVSFTLLYARLIVINFEINRRKLLKIWKSLFLDSTTEHLEKIRFLISEFDYGNISSDVPLYPVDLIEHLKQEIRDLQDVRVAKDIEQIKLIFENDKRNYFNQKAELYNNMFVVSPVKQYFQNRHSKETIERYESANQPDLFDVPNSNVYDDETGELIRIGTQTDYNSDFLLKLHHSYVLDVKPFLTYQYNGSANPEAFLDYVKFAALNDPIVEHESIKSAIRDWLSQQQTGNISGKVDELPGRTKELIQSLKEYSFESFLVDNSISPDKIYRLLAEHTSRELLPYSIALLHELKYLEFFFKEYAKNKVSGYKLLAKIFGSPERRVKGNVLVLNPNSKEDSTEYTSVLYIEKAKIDLAK